MSDDEDIDLYDSSDESDDDYEPESSDSDSFDAGDDVIPDVSTTTDDSPVSVRTYGDRDPGPRSAPPPFRPDNVPGLHLPDDRTKKDRRKYLTPGSFFKLFFTVDLLQQLCIYTNEYYDATHHLRPSLAKQWKPVTPEEIYVFVALLMYFGVVRLPQLELYWSTKQLFHGLWARAFLSKFRYKQLQSFLKVSNRNTESRKDKLTKARFLHNYVKRKCMKLWQPNEWISVDERMVANKGRYGFRQYIKDKPTKWGMKLWVLADSLTGFTCNFEVYLGRDKRCEDGLGHRVVTDLCKHLYGMGYKLFVDNFYSSLKLFRTLLEKGITACGTIQTNRTGFPKVLKNVKDFNKRAVRGAMRWIRLGDVGVLQWKDNKVVSVITTMHRSISDRMFCMRRVKVNGEFRKQEVSQPAVLKDYNKYMGGVDRSDQMIGKYKVLRRCSKFWKTIFYHMIDIARINSFIMFQEFRKREQNANVEELKRPSNYSLLDYTIELIKELGNISEDVQVPLYQCKVVEMSGGKKASSDSHVVVPVPTSVRRNCFRCYRLEKVERKTSYKCATCDKNFCFNQDRNCLLLDHPKTVEMSGTD